MSPDDDDSDPSPADADAPNLFVLSQNTLHGTPTDQTLTSGWSDRPPLFPDGKSFKNNKALKRAVRRGPIPPALRSAVWLISIVGECNPHESRSYAESFGTLDKASSLDRSYEIAKVATCPDESDWSDAVMPRFGLDCRQMKRLLKNSHGGLISMNGYKSLTKVLCTAQHVLGVEYAPLLPDIAAVLLGSMPESAAYAAIREMLQESARYLPVGPEEHHALCKTFADIVERLYPNAAVEMERCGASSPKGLDPIMRRFFVPILRYDHVLRVMDMYAIEGMKALLRIASGLTQLLEEKFHFRNVTDARSYWRYVREFARSDDFDFDLLVKKAYGLHGTTGVGGGRLLRRRNFPRRRVLARMVRYNERWAADNDVEIGGPQDDDVPAKPMGLVKGDVEAILAKPASIRSNLAEWLPPVYRRCKLELLYSTNNDGRTLSQFYGKVSRTKRTITLVEVLDQDDNSHRSSSIVVGMYASQAWRSDPRIYGDGECFLFRCRPDPKCFKWKPNSPGSLDDDVENEALMEQFMVSRDTFLSMGGNEDGSSGLRLNEDLTRGESAPALGFDNEPLAGRGRTEFEVGAVEVYRLVREVDGKAVGGDDNEDPIWNL